MFAQNVKDQGSIPVETQIFPTANPLLIIKLTTWAIKLLGLYRL